MGLFFFAKLELQNYFFSFPRSFFNESTFVWSGAGWTMRLVSLFTGACCWWQAAIPIQKMKLTSNNKLFVFNDRIIGL